MIQISNLTKVYTEGFIPRKVTALNGLSLRVNRGETFGFLGPNGAGKTTTIKILLNLIQQTSGSAQLNGIDISKPSSRVNVGFMPEQPYFYSYLTGRELLEYCGKMTGSSVDKKSIDALIDRVGLLGKESKPLGTYSRGMLQRIGIAQALVGDPDLLILDEPLSGLDPIGRVELLEILNEQKAKGKTLFFSSHILADAETICDRIGIMNKGVLIEEGSLSSFLQSSEVAQGAEIDFKLNSPDKTVLPESIGTIQTLSFSLKRVTIADSAQVNEVITMLIKAGAEIQSVNHSKISLEKLFVEKVGER